MICETCKAVILMDVGQLIAQRRKELGLTLEELGNKVGVSKSTVRKWETGHIENMKRDKIAAIANALQIKPSLLLEQDVGNGGAGTDFVQSLTKSEQTHIKKYRILDNHGKKTVDIILDSEYERVTHLGIYRAAHSEQGTEHEIISDGRDTIEKLKNAKHSQVTRIEDL